MNDFLDAQAFAVDLLKICLDEIPDGRKEMTFRGFQIIRNKYTNPDEDYMCYLDVDSVGADVLDLLLSNIADTKSEVKLDDFTIKRL